MMWNVAYIFNLIPIYKIDLTPSAFTISGLAIAWGLLRFRLMDIIPIARDVVIENMIGGIIVLDIQNRVVDINPAARRIFGGIIPDVIGSSFTVIFPGQCELEELVNSDQEMDSLRIKIERNKSLFYYNAYVTPLKGRHDRLIGHAISLHDITENKIIEEKNRELEERVNLTSRLSMVGEMATGIAHDLSNPLTAVLGYTDLVLKQGIPDKARDDIQMIERDAQRAVGILDRLLKFAGQQGLVREYVDINPILETAVGFQRNSLSGNNIRIVLQFEEGQLKTFADGGQLQEVFLNLIDNAEKSLVRAYKGEGGMLIISTLSKEDRINIVFSDNGTGINKEDLSKVFEPFFTTMEAGRGTGLGLSISQGIINKHGGVITVESDTDVGATFTIKLPISVPDEESL